MSKDSSATYIHMHQPRLADLFEEFTRPHTSAASTSTSANLHTTSQPGGTTTAATGASAAAAAVTYGSSSSPASIPSFLPIEDIYVAPQYQPPNPEDEDDVVPDQHAAFGITRAMERRREAVWRDLGLEALVNGQGHGGAGGPGGSASGGGGALGVGGVSGPAATLRGGAGGGAAAGSAAVRVRSAGRRMGGRRVVCLR